MSVVDLLRDRRHRRLGHDRLRDPEAFLAPLRGGIGLEVGGPSAVFRTGDRLPAYAALARVDGIQFAKSTVWHGDMGEGRYDPGEPDKGGHLYIREGSDLEPIADGSLDAVLSSHVVEHFANPIGALREWRRAVRPGGHFLLIAPHFEGTFDHRRAVTPLEHLIADAAAGTPEDDPTHFDEFFALHDAARNPPARDRAAFRAQVDDNFRQRIVHHHVFDTRAILRLLDHVGLAVRAAEARWPHDIVVLAERLPDGTTPDNAAWLAPDAVWARDSPFKADR